AVIAALRARDERVFAELMRMYNASLLRVALIYVATRAVAEDVVQETWIGVLNGIDRFEGRSSLKTWIFRILTNIAKTRGQREGRTLPFSALERPGSVPEAAVEPERVLPPEHERWPGHWASKPTPWPEARLLAAETRELVELVTSYLEDALSGAERAEFERHLERCDGCREYLEQMRKTIELTGSLSPADLTAEAEQKLLAAFRDWKPA